MINPVFNEPLLFLLGPGRSYLGIKNSVFDSDYIYVFINYGLFITLFLIITFLTKFLINFKLISLESKILFFIVLVGISINFFFDMKILLILPFKPKMNTKHNKLTIQELKDFKKKKSRLIFDIVEKYFNKKVEDISILDYGCGRITILLKQLGYNVYGVDTINKSDDICMELGFNHNEIFKENNNYEIPFNDGYYYY